MAADVDRILKRLRKRFGLKAHRLELMLTAMHVAEELKFLWAIVGIDHEWESLLVWLDAVGMNQQLAVPSGFVVHPRVITAWPSVVHALSHEQDEQNPGIPAGARATITITVRERHFPLRYVVDASSANKFLIHELHAGVEPLILGAGPLSGGVFLAEQVSPIQLKHVLMETGMDASVDVINLTGTPQSFRSALIGRSARAPGAGQPPTRRNAWGGPILERDCDSCDGSGRHRYYTRTSHNDVTCNRCGGLGQLRR